MTTTPKLKIKVCGMLHPDNIAQVAALGPDYMGFIFYPLSPRYAAALDPVRLDELLPATIRRTGVFVDASLREILKTAEKYRLTTIQLHGGEPPEMCRSLRRRGFEVVKVFSVAYRVDLMATAPYEAVCDLLLFDTRTPEYGGSGKRFDWKILEFYKGTTPFMLSGGISPFDAAEILTLPLPALWGVDLNSRFEVEAGLKNPDLLERFIKNIRQ